ncbi:MAG: sulfotransferase family 2 domain-containing protein [Opitutae bacterium]|nr:sulfotransferase family 2 domain-containing protein [Opitutae bacterium]MDG1300036.1 sulfotransferase family 2 domain-containing protein [Opitutae bacterium]
MKRRFRYSILRAVSKKYDLKYRASNEAAQWEGEGYNYLDLWRHHSLFIKETNSVYIAISKSANSSVRRALSDSTFSEAFDRKRNKLYGVYQLHAVGKVLSDLATDKIPVFTVVRNPVTRFWSAYQDKIVDHPKYGLAEEVARFHGKSAEQSDHISAEMVLDYMEQTPVHRIEEHLRPQWACCGHGRISFQMIAKVEKLRSDLESAAKQGLFPRDALARLKHSNPSNKNTGAATQKQLRSRIEAYYAKDYQAFGY